MPEYAGALHRMQVSNPFNTNGHFSKLLSDMSFFKFEYIGILCFTSRKLCEITRFSALLMNSTLRCQRKSSFV